MAEHEDFKAQCRRSGVKYFEIMRDYDEEILKIYDYNAAEKQRLAMP